jgi:hypothetical protein
MPETRYSCGCVVRWDLGPPPAKCPAHWLQEQIRTAPGGHKLEAALRAARPARVEANRDA